VRRRDFIFVAVMSSSIGCDDGPTRPNFVVQVLGDRQALNSVQTRATRLEAVGPQNDRNRPTPEFFESSLSWETLASTNFDVEAQAADGTLSHVHLAPYLCPDTTDFANRLRIGWTAKETHQIYLTSGGDLEVDTDFSHVLSYSCEWQPPRGAGQVEGVTAPISAAALCTNQGSETVSMTMVGRLWDMDVNTIARICWGELTDKGDGHLILTFSADVGSATVSVIVDHCLQTTEVLPSTYSFSTSAQSCSLDVAGMISDVSLQRAAPLQLSDGLLTLRSLDSSKGGRAAGTVSVLLQSNAGSLTVQGDYDLKLTRIPVEGDWPNP